MNKQMVLKQIFAELKKQPADQPVNLTPWLLELKVANGTNYLADADFEVYDFLFRQIILTHPLINQLQTMSHQLLGMYHDVDTDQIIATLKTHQKTVPYQLAWPAELLHHPKTIDLGGLKPLTNQMVLHQFHY